MKGLDGMVWKIACSGVGIWVGLGACGYDGVW